MFRAQVVIITVTLLYLPVYLIPGARGGSSVGPVVGDVNLGGNEQRNTYEADLGGQRSSSDGFFFKNKNKNILFI